MRKKRAQKRVESMKKWIKMSALLLALVMILGLTACGGSKDALSGTWSAELGEDGVITWTFNGKGKCTMENAYMKQNGTYTVDGDQLTVTLESWSEPSTYTFSLDGNSLTMNEKSGYGISGTIHLGRREDYETSKDKILVSVSCGADAACIPCLRQKKGTGRPEFDRSRGMCAAL